MMKLKRRLTTCGGVGASLLLALAVVLAAGMAEAGRKGPGARTKLGEAYFGERPGEALLYESSDVSLIRVEVWHDATWQTGDYYGYKATGPDLPFGVKSVARLSGRKFEIVDAGGSVVVSSVLPKLDTRTFGGLFAEGIPPFSLRIADRKGQLQDIAELEWLPIH
ncbi:MAG: hypothetical protein ACYTDU_10955 [Planctomycetota bacterium]|jgi:hypothetical protein